MLLANVLAATRSYSNDPVVVGFALMFFAINLFCIYRCIRGGHWVLLILGFFCTVCWWVGAVMGPNHRRVKRGYRYGGY